MDLSELNRRHDEVIYKQLKQSLKSTLHLGYTLNRLEKEFKDSLDASLFVKP